MIAFIKFISFLFKYKNNLRNLNKRTNQIFLFYLIILIKFKHRKINHK